MEAEPDSVQWLAGNQCSELFPFQPLGREPGVEEGSNGFSSDTHTYLCIYI
jgi:hypothetical protein